MTETPLQRARRIRKEEKEAVERYLERLKASNPVEYKYQMDLREFAKKEAEYRRNNPNWYTEMKDNAREQEAKSVTTTYEHAKKKRETKTNEWLGLNKL